MKKEKEMLIPKGCPNGLLRRIPTRVVSILLLWVACIGQGLAQGGSYADSPFGIFGPYETFLDSSIFVTKGQVNDYLKDIQVKWVQEVPRGNDLDTVSNSGASIYSRALPDLGNPRGPNLNYSGYEIYLKGILAKYKDKIKYWEVDTEPDLPRSLGGWIDYPEEYAKFLKFTYQIIKQECSDCKVVFGGIGGTGIMIDSNYTKVQFLKKVLEAGGSKYFDIFEFKQHHHPAKDYTKLIKNKMEVYGKVLSQYGIDIKQMPVFIETAMYDGTPKDPVTGISFPTQSESEQAAGVIKTYTFALAQGIDKIFWNLVVEHGPNKVTNGVFQNYGLVQNPRNDGKSHKKLSYYTYKKMVEILEGSDWKNIQAIQESSGIYIYKFTKTGKPIWVAWNDSSVTRTVTISGISSNRVGATEAVPKYESGKDVADYTTAFQTDTLVVTNGAVALTLGQRPVFVEPFTLTSVEEERRSVPQEFFLYQNYPNPFNPTTNIEYRIQNKEYVSLKVYDVLGREVATLVNGELNAGEYSVVFDANGFASGVYMYQLTVRMDPFGTGTFVQQKKMVVIR